MEKVLTVSIAAYNVEKYIGHILELFCSDAVRRKTEVLVIDDGGNDSTLSIAREYEKKFPDTFKAVHKSNGGWGSTVNMGIMLATGKYFKLLDGDDCFNPKTIAAFVEFLDTADADMVYTPFCTFADENDEVISISTCNSTVPKNVTMSFKDTVELFGVAMHSCAFRTKMLQENKVRILENCFYTDNEYVIKSLFYVKTAIVFNKVVYCYRVGRYGQSVSVNSIKKHYDDYCKMRKSVLIFWQQKESNKEWPDYLDKYIGYVINNQYMVYAILGARKEAKLFDEEVRNKWWKFYSLCGRKVTILRKSHFWMVPLYSKYILIREWLTAKFGLKPETAFTKRKRYQIKISDSER